MDKGIVLTPYREQIELGVRLGETDERLLALATVLKQPGNLRCEGNPPISPF